MNSSSFSDFKSKISNDLSTLSSDSKRRYPDIKKACEVSSKILGSSSTFEDLCRNHNFVDPFISACLTENVKLASTAMLSYQRLATEQCISSQTKIDNVLDSFLTCTDLAVEIQLKVLQILPVFFKTYSSFITGTTLRKMLLCFTNLLMDNKSSVVTGSSSAILQQLINSIFERSFSSDSKIIEANKEFKVLVDNENNTIEINKYELDANIVFQNICAETCSNSLLDTNVLTIDIILEILESIFLNQKSVLISRKDLQFILRTIAIPLLLKEISAPSNKNFVVAVRSFRATKLLIQKDYMVFLDLELEVILSFLIHILEDDTTTPQWKKILVLEFFADFSFERWLSLYSFFDANTGKRKKVVLELLTALNQILTSNEIKKYMIESPILISGSNPIISYESSSLKIPLLDLVDKPNPPNIDSTYMVLLLLSTITNIASESETYALQVIQNKEKSNDIKLMIPHIFETMLKSLKIFFYSNVLDTNLFHRLVRAFQKLAHTCCLLKLDQEFNSCLNLFSKLIAELTTENFVETSDLLSINSQKERKHSLLTDQSVFGAITDTILGPSSHESLTIPQEKTSLDINFYPCSFHSRNLDMFKAFIALFVSSNPYLTQEHWNTFFKVWQWCNYYLVGPSKLFSDMFLNRSAPENSYNLSRQGLLSLENNFSRFFDTTARCPETAFIAITQSLINLSTQALKDEKHGGHIEPFDQNGDIQISTYNRDFFMNILESVSTVNKARIFRVFKLDTWSDVFNYFILEASTRKINLSQEIRIQSIQSFTNIIYGILSNAESDTKQFALIEEPVMQLFMKLIDSILVLDFSSSKYLYNGNIQVESDILLQSLKTVKDLVDNYGDYLKNSWSCIFKIIDSPFSMIKDFKNTDAESEEERLAIQESLVSKQKAMIQVSFSVFKLISDDFLQTLPLIQIKDIIKTLVFYVSQDIDLNISFSSISYFWIVGDYLRYFKSTMNSSISETPSFYQKLSTKIKKFGDIDALISSDGLTELELYNSLWLSLLSKINACARDARLEVKNGSVKTFFRIIDSHSTFLPSWDLIFEFILQPLLESKDPDVPSEFADITLKGLLQIFNLYFSNFKTNYVENTSKWTQLVDYISSLLMCKNFDTVFIVFENYQLILESCFDYDFPKSFVEKCYDTWKNYEIDYTDFTKADKKTNYDCIEKMIACYPSLHRQAVKRKMVSQEYVAKTVQTFGQAIKYPLLPSFGSDKLFLSSLQKSVLAALACFDDFDEPAILSIIMFQYASISVLQFGTKDTIHKKLGSKLPENVKSRIPTFEAVGYEAAKILNEKIKNFSNLNTSFLNNNKSFINMLLLLSELTVSKSYVDFSKGKTCPLWILASETLFTTSQLILSSEESDYKTDVLKLLTPIITEVMIALLGKSSDDVQGDEAYRIREYQTYKGLFISNIDNFESSDVEKIISSLWSCSFFYEIDEVEDQILSSSKDLNVFVKKLVTFDFDNILGAIDEPIVLSTFTFSHLALIDLVEFSKNVKLRNICKPYLLARIAIVLRKFISDEKLRYRKPASTVREKEIVWILAGLYDICESLDDKEYLNDARILYPFILKTIPASNKFSELQPILQKLCLLFASI